MKLNEDGTLTVTYTFGATDKAKLLYIKKDMTLSAEHGTKLTDMNQPFTTAPSAELSQSASPSVLSVFTIRKYWQRLPQRHKELLW